MSARLERIIESLSKPGCYPHAPSSVEVIQTHISVIFIAGDLVYKVKKPLDLGFLDFSSTETRRVFCQREVELNSRFAPGWYLGVVWIFEDENGFNLAGHGREAEPAVLMKRIPLEYGMPALLSRELVTPSMLDRLSARIAEIHRNAPTGPHISRFGARKVIAQNIRENFNQTERFVGRTLDGETRRTVLDLSLGFLKTHSDLFLRRVDRGFIRDCHGDLHLEHVVILNGIILFDCIEFNDRFRYGDTASDIAFLLMDLDYGGFPAYAARLSEGYADCAQDEECLALFPFYKAYRAYIRGKVASFTLDEPEVTESTKNAETHEAGDYFHLAASYLRPALPPALFLTTGFTGAGKSFLATRLSDRLGVEVFRSDVMRKELFSVAPAAHRLDKYGEGIYTSKASARTYRALLDAAETSLRGGKSVILDAAFLRREAREAAYLVAKAVGARTYVLECACPEGVARTRLEARANQPDEPSDGRWEVYVAQRAEYEPPGPDEEGVMRRWDSTTEHGPFLREIAFEVLTGKRVNCP
jgi:aminoglycoside phosphotransferase family enzyme/predicted kinase